MTFFGQNTKFGQILHKKMFTLTSEPETLESPSKAQRTQIYDFCLVFTANLRKILHLAVVAQGPVTLAKKTWAYATYHIYKKFETQNQKIFHCKLQDLLSLTVSTVL